MSLSSKKQYFLLIARMEPENNVETILDGFNLSNDDGKWTIGLFKTENEFSSPFNLKIQEYKEICL